LLPRKRVRAREEGGARRKKKGKKEDRKEEGENLDRQSIRDAPKAGQPRGGENKINQPGGGKPWVKRGRSTGREVKKNPKKDHSPRITLRSHEELQEEVGRKRGVREKRRE